MDNILFVNFSDIHFSIKNKTCIEKKIASLIEIIDIQKILKRKEHVIVLISGDIAFSGEKEEYEAISELFNIMKKKYYLVMCPGNHDHDFSRYSEVARNAMLGISIEEIDDAAISFASSGMENYNQFERKYSSFEPVEVTNLSKLYEVDLSSEKFSILTLNTAWCSKLHERGGDISYPENKIIQRTGPYNSIIMFHHPLSWFEPNNSKAIRNIIRNNYSIALTGHEHISDSFKIDTDSSTTLMIESLPIDDYHVSDNGFMTFEIEGGDILISTYIWNGSTYDESQNFLKSDVIELKKALVSNNFEVSKKFYTFLQDLGAEYIHPTSKKLILDDVFVYPNIRDLSDDKEQTRKISSNKLLNNNVNRIILIGDEFCGKTTILKKYYFDTIKKEKLVLFLDGNIIKKSNKSITKILTDAVTSQYTNRTVAEFMTYKAERILLIDDFQDIKGDVNSLREFLSPLEKTFDKIIITLSDSCKFAGTDIIESSPFTSDYKQYQMLKFGFRLRYELANRWNTLKSTCAEEKSTLIHANDSSTKMINTIIGKNYIPSIPFFLLTMLQSIDNEQSSDLKTSSYGYYYQFLITSSLGNASVRKEQLDEIFNYITELSFYFYKNKTNEESKENLWDFNNKICSEYGVQLDFGERFNLLVKAKIMEIVDSEHYRFKYNYVYYFFIAKYFSDHLRDVEVVEEIKNLTSTLHLKQSMNILMFLTHHSKDQFILDLITDQAKLLFNKFEPATIDLDTDFINSIVDNLPEISFVQKDRLEFRREVEESKDISNEDNNSDELEDESVDSEKNNKKHIYNGIDLSLELNLTVKSLELLGQLSRNYYGSLKIVQKELLLDEAINAPLRSLNFLLSSARDEPEKTIDTLEQKINEVLSGKKNLTSTDVRALARKILFRMLFTITYSIVSKIASSIGSSHLQPVIDKVCDSKNSDAGKIIKLASILEVGQNISIDELKKLNSSLSKNSLSKLLVKALVVNYLYMFERPDKQVQKICAAVDIKYDTIAREIGFQKISK
ncbi:TPA: metallophosphoesterase [Yersinia enterocolitica]|uniref:STAND family AAA ATPase n=1 Tax=Yersinia enterocolitica TaxID=630 RepID=UPI0027F658CD|nr:metallophosphoesterase [Yersinia enterocolitica]EKN6282662.1 metallophosphoesterase [Yersinia enterocolitica]ELY5202209.1 metallophosphoesterase [Yersinia enterocolitica]ELY5239982.1 metallophosphoesterase [Yersinia enterocolitica]HDM9021500.1 metallophosphoesterase [Yersinia enterocolitica]